MNSPHHLKLLVLALTLTCAIASRAEPTPAAGPHVASYAGQQQRAIKSLSESDVAGLLAGQGAGFAKAAELNGYPGPAHVLELAAELRLDAAQIAATRELHGQHKREAGRLGASLVEAERHLDGLFAHREATPQRVDGATARVGQLQAQLRAEHLKTHLTQTALLNVEQVQRYAHLRGYAATSPSAPANQGGGGGSSIHPH